MRDHELDRWCTAQWERLNAERQRVADAAGYTKPPHLHPMDPGRAELALRMRSGHFTREQVEHAIAAAVAEAEFADPPSLRWLDGGIFKEHRLTKLIASSLDEVKRRAKPKQSADVRVGRVEPSTVYPEGVQEL